MLIVTETDQTHRNDDAIRKLLKILEGQRGKRRSVRQLTKSFQYKTVKLVVFWFVVDAAVAGLQIERMREPEPVLIVLSPRPSASSLRPLRISPALEVLSDRNKLRTSVTFVLSVTTIAVSLRAFVLSYCLSSDEVT